MSHESRHINGSRHINKWVMSPVHVLYHPCELATAWINTSRHIWMRRVTYECVTRHVTYENVTLQMNESRHTQVTAHMTYDPVMSHTNESRHICSSHVTYAWVTSHMIQSCHRRMSHVTYDPVMSHTNESRHIWSSHVTYEWVESHMNVTLHVTLQMNESRHTQVTAHTYEWVESQMNASCHRLIGQSKIGIRSPLKGNLVSQDALSLQVIFCKRALQIMANNGSFAKNDLQLKLSYEYSPPCTRLL